MMKQKFQWLPFLKKLAAIAVPVALQNLLSNTGSMVDEVMIASLGENTVGAVGLCAQFTMLVFGSYWGIIACGTLFISQYWGAKDEKGLCRSYGFMWALVMFVGVLFCVITTVFPREVMEIYTDKKTLQDIGARYLGIIGFTFPLNVYCMAASMLLRGTGHVKIPLISSIISVAVNILFNWILIFGNLGFPAMGVEGAALATVIASGVNLLSILILSASVKFPYLFRIRDHFRFTKTFTKQFLKRAFPLICNEVFIAVSGSLISIIFGRQSEAAIAAFAVISVLEGIYISFFTGFSNASAILVGNSIGAGRLEEAWGWAPRLVVLCAAMIAVIDVPILLLGKPLLSLMGLSGESLTLGWGCLITFSIVMIFRMGNWLMNDTFRSGGDTVFGTVVELSFVYFLALTALAVFAGIIPVPFMAGVTVPFVALFAIRYCDEPIRFVIMMTHMIRGKWIHPVTADGQEALPAFRKAHGIPEPRAKGK